MVCDFHPFRLICCQACSDDHHTGAFGQGQFHVPHVHPNSGEHFYTANVAEGNKLLSAGWKYEGVTWTAPKTSKTPVYRLYNPNSGDHHYTTNPAEKSMLTGNGWKDEGIGWYSDDNKGVPVYRQYNKNAKTGSHNYTANLAENDMLVKNGWKAEGISWYGVK